MRVVHELLRIAIISSLFYDRDTHTHEARAVNYQQATEWCEQRAVDTQTAILQITGWSEFNLFREEFESLIEAAELKVAQSHVKMGGGGNLDLIYQLAKYIQAKYVIETGVSYGWSSLALLLALKNHPDSILISTDLPYFSEDHEKYVGYVVPSTLKSKWKILPFADREALPQALDLLPTIDMAHYDSDKFYEGRMWAYPQLWNALRSNGIFISDDINDDFGFRDFCLAIGQDPLIVKTPMQSGHKYVGVVIKPDS